MTYAHKELCEKEELLIHPLKGVRAFPPAKIEKYLIMKIEDYLPENQNLLRINQSAVLMHLDKIGSVLKLTDGNIPGLKSCLGIK